MKLTKEDKALLTAWGHKEEDLKQIERATTKTTYELSSGGINRGKISLTEVLDILGREKYLSGISRSAFHWSACRENEKGQRVYFDSSKLFQ